jgi:hypothetical protein
MDTLTVRYLDSNHWCHILFHGEQHALLHKDPIET